MSLVSRERVAPAAANALPPARPAHILIATLNRQQGITGVHTHTNALMDGFVSAGHRCDLISPFSEGNRWLPLFAVRPLLLHRLNRTWSTHWYRHWHRKALSSALL